MVWLIKWFERHLIFSWLITIIIAFLIFYISSLTFAPGKGTGFLSYIYHFTAFSYLALFLLISLSRGKIKMKKSINLIILGIIIAIIYGILDEIHQYFVPGRYPSIKDILINSVGILITSIAYIRYVNSNK